MPQVVLTDDVEDAVTGDKVVVGVVTRTGGAARPPDGAGRRGTRRARAVPQRHLVCIDGAR